MKRKSREPRTVEWQEWVLNRLVEEKFVKTKKEVKGPYTTIDFVMWSLNNIFGPSNWNSQILEGPTLHVYQAAMGYVQVTVRLTVRFANGDEVVHDEVGVWPLRATKSVGALDKTAPEIYELAIKSAVTDGLKACTDHIGKCFRPITDLELKTFLRQRQVKESLEEKELSAEGEPPKKSAADLFGEKQKPAPAQAETPKASVEYPKDITELYKRADDELGVSPKDAAEILMALLAEKHGEGATISAYLKTSGDEALLALWDWLREALRS